MAQASMTIKVKVKWWLKLYLSGLIMICWLTDNEPDVDKVQFWLNKGIKLEKV